PTATTSTSATWASCARASRRRGMPPPRMRWRRRGLPRPADRVRPCPSVRRDLELMGLREGKLFSGKCSKVAAESILLESPCDAGDADGAFEHDRLRARPRCQRGLCLGLG